MHFADINTPECLHPINITPPSLAWKTDFKSIPSTNQEMFYAYAAVKKEGSTGQQEKASRNVSRLVSVKCFFIQTLTKMEFLHSIYSIY